MRFNVFIVLALIGFAAAAQLPDSATQGPNPQDIATPEPEYIDIDVPESAPAPAPAPAPRPVSHITRASAFTLPRPVVSRPHVVPQPQPQLQLLQRQQYLPPLVSQPIQRPQALAGHTFNTQSGYQYRRPVYVRRYYRLRRY